MSQARDDGELRPQALGQLLGKLARRGGLVLVRGSDARWHQARMPPARGSGSYLEVLASGELRQWLNDGHGNFRVLRSANGSAHPTPPPGPSGAYLRRYSSGRCALEACPSQEQEPEG